MKRLITSVTIGGDRLPHFHGKVRNYFDKTIPTIKRYAAKVGADFYLHSSPTKDYPSAAWEKLHCLEYGERFEYDQVLYLDADIIVDADSPDIFEEFPKGSTWVKRDASIERENGWMEQYLHWRSVHYLEPVEHRRYFNTGVMLFDGSDLQQLTKQFTPPFVEGVFEQHFLNRAFDTSGIQIFNLPSCWNFIIMRDEDLINDGRDKHFKHYASTAGKRLLNRSKQQV